MQEIIFNRKPFLFIYSFNARNLTAFSKSFVDWLHSEHFYFEIRTQDEICTYEIKCDDLVDAAKIQTFIDTH